MARPVDSVRHADGSAAAVPAPVGGPSRILSIEPLALEIPLGRTVATPIAPVRTLVSLMLVVRDADGVEGWGEIWCNFPRFGLRHRARLLTEIVAPLLIGRTWTTPADAWAVMNDATRILRVQSGEPGPIAAVIAGVDIALHDIAAQRAGLPLWRMLGGGEGGGVVPGYASVGRADDVGEIVERGLARGFRAFKLRSSGGIDEHLAAVLPVRERVGDTCELMLDVNSSWDADDAIETVGRLDETALAWLEEPVPADTPPEVWRRLRRATAIPLAGGENLIAPPMFDAALATGALRVLQPDITKWGGFTGGVPLARRIVAAGRRLCPHTFSGAVGLVASAHLLAASGARNGMIECGIGDHPARDALLEGWARGPSIALGEAAGLGAGFDRRRLAPYLIGT
ncbi:MAG: mandelate racemase/muconate lactonizing enzyme family protein [Burkholderiales bacterium]